MKAAEREIASGPVFAAIGLVAGALGGLLGVGGGFIMVPLQVFYGRMGQHAAQATSLAAIVPGSIVGVLVYYFGASQPQVDLRFALLLVIGSAAGAYGGARVMTRVPERALKVVFAVILALLGVKELVAP